MEWTQCIWMEWKLYTLKVVHEKLYTENCTPGKLYTLNYPENCTRKNVHWEKWTPGKMYTRKIYQAWVLGDCIKFGHFLPNSDLFRATFVADCIKFWSFCKILVFFGLFQKKPEFRAEARNSGLSGSTVFDCSWGTLFGKSFNLCRYVFDVSI